MSSFPTSPHTFTNFANGALSDAAQVTDIYGEVEAIEAGYLNGTARLNSSNSTVAKLSVTGGSTLTTLNVTSGSTLTTVNVTGGSTLAGLTVASTASFASSVTFSTGISASGTIRTLGLSSAIANRPTFDVSQHTLALASGESTTFTGFTAGRVTLYEALATGDAAWISVANSRTTIVHQTGTVYSTVQNSTTKINISVSAGTMTLQNQAGDAIQLRAEFLKLT